MLRLPESGFEHIVRPIAFTTGAVARSVKRITDIRDPTELLLRSIDVTDSRHARRKLNNVQGTLWHSLMSRLREKNTWW